MSPDQQYSYEYPKADVSTDAVVFGLDLDARKLKVLLILRGREQEPYFGSWALPGGFLNMKETLDDCVRRELVEETGLALAYMEQLHTFSKVALELGDRTITVAYWGITRPDHVRGMDDAQDAQWFDVEALPELAFDHVDILKVALARLRKKLQWAPVGVWLLPSEFTLPEMQNVYEVILGRPLDKGNFRRKFLKHTKSGLLQSTGKRRKQRTGRPAQTYTFNHVSYFDLMQQGFSLKV